MKRGIAEIIESRSVLLIAEPLPARRKALPGHLEREERLLDVEGVFAVSTYGPDLRL